jgi:hypothetical protein
MHVSAPLSRCSAAVCVCVCHMFVCVCVCVRARECVRACGFPRYGRGA